MKEANKVEGRIEKMGEDKVEIDTNTFDHEQSNNDMSFNETTFHDTN